ncbi:hypothetical protein C7426_1294, partial [Pantoea ananatis]
DFCNYIEERWNTRPQLIADEHETPLLQPDFLIQPDNEKP